MRLFNALSAANYGEQLSRIGNFIVIDQNIITIFLGGFVSSDPVTSFMFFSFVMYLEHVASRRIFTNDLLSE